MAAEGSPVVRRHQTRRTNAACTDCVDGARSVRDLTELDDDPAEALGPNVLSLDLPIDDLVRVSLRASVYRARRVRGATEAELDAMAERVLGAARIEDVLA